MKINSKLSWVKLRQKGPKATGWWNPLRVFWRTRAPLPSPQNLPPRDLPPRNLPAIKTQTTTIPHAPKARRRNKHTDFHSMGRRLQHPQTCTSRPPSHEGDTWEFWVCPKFHHLHPSKCTTCARQSPYGSIFHPFQEHAIPWPNNKEIYPCSSSYCSRPWSEIHPRPKEIHPTRWYQYSHQVIQ